jgi:glycerol kinase
MEALLAIDAGTTGVTAMLFDRGLAPLARVTLELEQLFPEPGLVEHDAGAILEAVDRTLAELLDRAPEVAIAALGITNQRETVFALDLERGAALGTGIVWQDRRTAARCAELAGGPAADRLRRRTGLVVDPYFSATKIEWMLAHRPEVLRAAQAGRVRFATVDALIVHHLTGGAVCATDPTNASRTLLFDIDARAWSDELCALFGVRAEWLPEVRPSTASFGAVCTRPGFERLAGVPIHGVAGDQQAALFGQGCWDEGASKNTYGTGCFLLLNTGATRRDSGAGLLTTLAVGRGGEPVYAVEGSVFAAGLVVQWLRDQAGFLERAEDSERIARSVPDTGGVFLVPAFAGLGAPYWDAGARAAILGLTRGTSRAHIVRAGLEAIAFQCAEVIACLRADTGLALAELRVDGGASRNDFLMQAQADLAGVEVLRPKEVESTARGAAALAGLGAGLVRDPGRAAGAAGGRLDRFRPALGSAERERRLAAWREAVERVREPRAGRP